MKKKVMKDGMIVVEPTAKPQANRSTEEEFNAGIKAICEALDDRSVIDAILAGKRVRIKY